jgi:glutathione synthase/RimK-type ligase-like ATP-grasp enzyme
MILVCGDSADPVTNLFCVRLDDYGADYRFLDLRSYPRSYKIVRYRQTDKSNGSISCADWSLRIEDIEAVFVRNLYDPNNKIDDRHGQDVGVALEAELNLGLHSLFTGLRCPVVNSFAAIWANQSKPYQATLIQRAGLLIPATLITTNVGEARRFCESMENGGIYKSASAKTIGTRQVDLKTLPALMAGSKSAIYFQEYVRGSDIRVHVVGTKIFATKVNSGLVDYRFEETGRLRMEATSLPCKIAGACIHLTQRLGLLFSGIDLRETPEGDFYCFEVNAQPGFTFFEQRTGQPISRALWELLSGN